MADVAIVGAGPGGLMAAERLAASGHRVTLYDQMPSPGRKFLMAGRGGLNITHSEDLAQFQTRYGAAKARLTPLIARFPPAALIAWVQGLGQETIVGSSGRVFPKRMKTSPLLRAWLARLQAAGVTLNVNHTWTGFADGGCGLVFQRPGEAPLVARPDAVVLATGGASWPRLGSTGAWVPVLAAEGIAISPLTAANCGLLVSWSNHLVQRYGGAPLKRISLTHDGVTARGEAIVTRSGLEGGAVYALASRVSAAIAAGGRAELTLDLRPDMKREDIAGKLAAERGKQSSATFLRKTLKLAPVAIALLRETGQLPAEGAALARRIKAVPLTVTGCAGLERAISTAGGVTFDALDDALMLRARPGVFVAGEMLDWDAPTGGYLLQATFATAVTAADGCHAWLSARNSARP